MRPAGLINLSVPQLTSGAGGDPWTLDEELQAGDPAAINNLADAYNQAAGYVDEAQSDFADAKKRFQEAYRRNGAEHPINDSAEVVATTEKLHLQRAQIAGIAVDLETIAAALASAQRGSDAEIAGTNTLLSQIDDNISVAEAAGQDASPLYQTAIDVVRETLSHEQAIHSAYLNTLHSAQAAMLATTGYAADALVPSGEVSDEAPPLDAGAQERPGITDVNDPGVAWQDGFDPSQWKTSWHNPLLTDNPPGYTGGPGPERDAAWRNYLAHFPTTERGFLPNPDAVDDTGLKVLGNAGTQMGTSYAWGGKGLRTPGRGTLANDPQGGGAHVFGDNQRIGFDCSGLAEYAAWQANQTDIGIWTGSQVVSSNLAPVPDTGSLKPGDFIYYGPGDAHHVGIFVSPGVILNAPESGLPVQVQKRTTALGADPIDTIIRGLRLP